ncbi:hypothetical protein SAMN02744040_02139 [Tepidibacter thalassicus DSM 15285]|uniref:GGDEF domain-containing protein n=1 Tax=Tepidibacter thalassicus DSM 15285 TaxID=1123350 RepID=A0A1M5TE89_9FIRM|nr:hypothetical protein [Tepidibacter thalassicus]SHH49125.1 hypothetical protein SAMN02744040_02139 [Tepidibacter thalassicus DSM 15285]
MSNNTDITLSASIAFMKNKEAIMNVFKKADEGLKKAKEEGKNGIVIFDRFIKWEDFNEIFDLGEYIYKNLQNQTYSQSFIYRLLSYTNMVEEYVNSNYEDVSKLLYISKFNYDIYRNLIPKIANKLGIKNYKKDEEIIFKQEEISKLKKYFDNIPDENSFIYKYMKIALNYAVRKNRGGE